MMITDIIQFVGCDPVTTRCTEKLGHDSDVNHLMNTILSMAISLALYDDPDSVTKFNFEGFVQAYFTCATVSSPAISDGHFPRTCAKKE